MWIHDIASDALLLIGRLQDEAASTRRDQEELALWRHIRETIFFISLTGQDYKLEDYLKNSGPTRAFHASESFKSHADACRRQPRSEEI